MENIKDLQESREATVIGVVCFVLTVATLAVAARIYTRAVLIRTVGIDDYMAVISLVRPIAQPDTKRRVLRQSSRAMTEPVGLY